MTQKKKSSLGQRTVTGAILIVLLVAALWIGGWVFSLIACLCFSVALHEELTALTHAGYRPVWWVSFVGLLIAVPLMQFYSSMVIIPVLTILSFCVLFQVMRRTDPGLDDIVMSILPMLSVVLPGMCLLGILDTQPRVLQLLFLVLVFAIAVGGDTFAYFVGSAVGGPKLCPHISPNKTVAGSVGGLLGSMLCAVVTGRIFTLCCPAFTGFPPIWGDVLVGLIGGIAGQMGDLFASMVKRHCKVKDFGRIFPGHGGMLDRLDSVLFTAIIVYSYRVILLASL